MWNQYYYDFIIIIVIFVFIRWTSGSVGDNKKLSCLRLITEDLYKQQNVDKIKCMYRSNYKIVTGLQRKTNNC